MDPFELLKQKIDGASNEELAGIISDAGKPGAVTVATRNELKGSPTP